MAALCRVNGRVFFGPRLPWMSAVYAAAVCMTRSWFTRSRQRAWPVMTKLLVSDRFPLTGGQLVRRIELLQSSLDY